MATLEEEYKKYQGEGYDQINSMYDAQKQATLSGLEQAYNQNLSSAEAARDQTSQQYQARANDLGAQYERNRKNLNEQAAANGLNTGTGSQMQLALNNNYMKGYGQVRTAEQQALDDANRGIENLKASYQSSVQQAVADNDYQRAQALLAEYQKQYQQKLQQAQQLASYGDFSAYLNIPGYDQSSVDAMRNAWIAANPDLAYNTGAINADQYYALTGQHSPYEQNAYANLYNLIASTGYSPTDEELAAAGMSREAANALASAYYGVGGSGSGSRRSSGSGSGSYGGYGGNGGNGGNGTETTTTGENGETASGLGIFNNALDGVREGFAGMFPGSTRSSSHGPNFGGGLNQLSGGLGINGANGGTEAAAAQGGAGLPGQQFGKIVSTVSAAENPASAMETILNSPYYEQMDDNQRRMLAEAYEAATRTTGDTGTQFLDGVRNGNWLNPSAGIISNAATQLALGGPSFGNVTKNGRNELSNGPISGAAPGASGRGSVTDLLIMPSMLNGRPIQNSSASGIPALGTTASGSGISTTGYGYGNGGNLDILVVPGTSGRKTQNASGTGKAAPSTSGSGKGQAKQKGNNRRSASKK